MSPPEPIVPPSSETLLAGLRGRDSRALDELYGLYAGLIHGLALRIVRDAGLAEEVTQDVFVYAWQHAARFDTSRGSLGSWLVTLARSRAIDRVRNRDSHNRRVAGLAREAAAEVSRPPDDPLQDVLAGEQGIRVRNALATLSPEQRQALEIAYFEGLSHREIAVKLGAPLGTVKTRIRQGMIRMRDALERGTS